MMIINNFVNISHPLYLHGHDFYILGRRQDNPHGDLISCDESKHDIVLNLINQPIRDTAKLPQRSWLMIDSIANNTDSCIFHCHIAFDMEAGMGLISHVNGDKIPSPPPGSGGARNFLTNGLSPSQPVPDAALNLISGAPKNCPVGSASFSVG
jgi:hypothetical protein